MNFCFYFKKRKSEIRWNLWRSLGHNSSWVLFEEFYLLVELKFWIFFDFVRIFYEEFFSKIFDDFFFRILMKNFWKKITRSFLTFFWMEQWIKFKREVENVSFLEANHFFSGNFSVLFKSFQIMQASNLFSNNCLLVLHCKIEIIDLIPCFVK